MAVLAEGVSAVEGLAGIAETLVGLEGFAAIGAGAGFKESGVEMFAMGVAVGLFGFEGDLAEKGLEQGTTMSEGHGAGFGVDETGTVDAVGTMGDGGGV